MNSVDENIRNAFIAVHKTHENVNQLMEYCRTIANEKTNYKTVNGKFLKWQWNGNYYGWCIDDFILLFQRETDKILKNEWRDGPIYAMEIMLHNDEHFEQLPTIYLSKFEYEDIASWEKGCSTSNHQHFLLSHKSRIYGYTNDWRGNILSYSRNERNSRSILRRSQKGKFRAITITECKC